MVKATLTQKQERFCQFYATTEYCFGNGVRAYAKAYGLDPSSQTDYETAKTNASRLLTNAHIMRRITELLQENGLNDAYVDKQLFFLTAQYKDLNVKLRAIQEYNKLKGRYEIPNQTPGYGELNLTTFQRLSPQQLDAIYGPPSEEAQEFIENWKKLRYGDKKGSTNEEQKEETNQPK